MRRVLGVGAILFACALGAAAALIAPAQGSTNATCTAAQQAAARHALTHYQATAAATRKAYFAAHKARKARAAYDRQQKAVLARLKAKASCSVQTPATTPTAGGCSPSLDPGGNGTNSVGPLRNAGVKGIGALNAVMIFVDFPNATATESTQSAFDTATNGAPQYFASQSYGRLKLSIAPVDKWYRMSKPDSSYGFGRGNFTFDQQLAYMQEAVNLADPDVDFSKYQLVYVVSTKNASTINYSPAFDPNHAPAFAIHADGNLIYGGATIGSDIYNTHWAWRVLAHETSHVFGLPDYYDIPNFDPNNYQQQFHYAGGWTIMSWNQVGAEWFAWDKYREGWIDPSQVACVGSAGASTTQTVTPDETSGGIKMIVAKTGPSTAVVAEVRALTGGDAGLCSSGVLVYSLDARNQSGQGPLQVDTPHPGDPGDSAKVDSCSILWNAPLQVGESWEDSSVKVEVLSANADGSFSVRVTHK